jgi:two-component system chemotaxis response regulator CheY
MKDRARRAGATGWIVKPFEDSRLNETIRRVLGM